MNDLDFFYWRRFKATIIALALVLTWSQRNLFLRIPGLMLDLICYLLCEKRKRVKMERPTRTTAVRPELAESV